MEPIKPSHREALKEAYPNVTDAIIDRVEELLARRFLVDPEADPQRIVELDRERARLVQREMPRYQQVLQIARAREQAEKGRP